MKMSFSFLQTLAFGIIFTFVLAENHTSRSAGLNASSTTISSPISSPSAGQNSSLYEKLPGLWFEICEPGGNPPCIAYCHSNDTKCVSVGTQVVSACNHLWDEHNDESNDWASPAPGWSTFVSTYINLGGPTTTTVEVYTSFSTADQAVVKQNLSPTGTEDAMVTITPVYAMGNPVPSLSLASYPGETTTRSWLTSPEPSCRYIGLSTRNDCGQCSILGGTVQLYYWPPATSTILSGTETESASMTITQSAVLPDGKTLYSPSVYISLHSISATDSCSQVGQNHSATLLTLNPNDVFTQFHFGGMVAASGANSYGRLKYADLTGLPPVTAYEDQPSCVMFGCSTIYPTFDPTLVVPLQLRSLDPAWSSCAAALEGL